MQLTRAGLATLAERSGRPDAFDPGAPDRRFAECCTRHGVEMVAAAPFLSARDYKLREGIHWNARGHRRMAALLRRLHAEFESGRLGRPARHGQERIAQDSSIAAGVGMQAIGRAASGR
jgi:hypothetical protein